MTRRSDQFIASLLKGFARLGAALLLLLSLMVTVDVVTRWITGRPFVGVFEISEVLLAIITFSAVGLVHLDQRLLTVDILSHRARGRRAAALRILDALIGLLIFGLLLWKSTEEFFKAWAGGCARRGMIESPTAIPVGFIALGSLAIVLALWVLLRRDFARLRDPADADKVAATIGH